MHTPITIIGTGRFGGYFARMIRGLGLEVNTLDVDPPLTETHKLKASRLVIFAVPIRLLSVALKQYVPLISNQTLVMDVCSVKVFPCKMMVKAFADREVSLLGTHPLFGPQSAPETCTGQMVAVCPLQGDSTAGINLLERLNLKLFECTSDYHDQESVNQVMDHFMGRAAQRLKVTRGEIPTKTHLDFMRIFDTVTGNDYGLFEDMNIFNPYAEPMRSALVKHFTDIHQELQAKTEEFRPELEKMLSLA